MIKLTLSFGAINVVELLVNNSHAGEIADCFSDRQLVLATLRRYTLTSNPTKPVVSTTPIPRNLCDSSFEFATNWAL